MCLFNIWSKFLPLSYARVLNVSPRGVFDGNYSEDIVQHITERDTVENVTFVKSQL